MSGKAKRAIVLVVDSLGIGCMEDYESYRKEDAQANTFCHVLDTADKISVNNFEKLGINRLLHHPRLKQDVQPLASYGAMRLLHHGADSYLGHQEIMGSKPLPPLIKAFSEDMVMVSRKLEEAGFKVETLEDYPVILVNDYVTVADNIETDFGHIYNVTGALNSISFEEVLKIGEIIRSCVQVARVIALGGNVGIESILAAIERTDEGAVGINCPKSGVYESGYRVKHMGYGINPVNQVSSIFIKNQLPVTLIGKMADVIDCEGAEKITAVETERVMLFMLDAMEKMDTGLISATVQETDLSGHMEDAQRYALKISTVDAYLGSIIDQMTEEDVLIITADHGNDPTIGHSHHTREKTFLLVYKKNNISVDLGERSTLSDIAATVCEMFHLPLCENGTSFYQELY